MSVPIARLRDLGRLIANDSHAASFQTLAQYRAALLREVVKMMDPPPHRPAMTEEAQA